MYQENPAVTNIPKNTYVLTCGDSARDMPNILPRLADFAFRLGSHSKIGDALSEGYVPHGFRKNVFEDNIASVRAIEMLKKKLAGEEFITEVPLPVQSTVSPAAPIIDLSKATIALMADGGIVPKGNPDRLESARATKWFKYSIAGKDDAKPSEYESVHGGFDITTVNEDPARAFPLDAMREMEKEGVIGKLYDYYYTTTGNATPVANCTRFGEEIAAAGMASNIDGIVLTGT